MAARFGDYRKDDPTSFNLQPQLEYLPQFMFNLRRSQFVQVKLRLHAITVVMMSRVKASKDRCIKVGPAQDRIRLLLPNCYVFVARFAHTVSCWLCTYMLGLHSVLRLLCHAHVSTCDVEDGLLSAHLIQGMSPFSAYRVILNTLYMVS